MSLTNSGRGSPTVVDLTSPVSSSPSDEKERKDSIIELLLSDDDDEVIGFSTQGYATVGSPKAEDEVSLKRARDESSVILSNPYLAKKRAFKSSTTEQLHTPTFQDVNVNAAKNPSPTLPLVVIRDDVTVTDDLLSLLDKINLPTAATCTNRWINRAPSNATSPCCNMVLHHIQQRDKWSCGFRNLQMLLTAVLPYYRNMQTPCSDETSKHLDNSNSTVNVIDIPTISELQTYLEEGWAAGYDPLGAAHYHFRIVGKSSQIGAVEVSSVLTHRWGLDSTVIQFIKCPESRQLLPHFVWNYFHSTLGTTHECHHCRRSKDMTTSERAKVLLLNRPPSTISTSYQNGSNVKGVSPPEHHRFSTCLCPVLPLYLQWQGHSVTIVGIERKQATSSTSGAAAAAAKRPIAASGMFLLVFDPGHSGSARKKELERGNPARMRLDCQKLSHKDCQIVMCSLRLLSSAEKMTRKSRIEAVTACKDIVMKQVK